MFAMMTPPKSFLPRMFLNHQRRRSGFKFLISQWLTMVGVTTLSVMSITEDSSRWITDNNENIHFHYLLNILIQQTHRSIAGSFSVDSMV
jgi:hypothetical protein